MKPEKTFAKKLSYILSKKADDLQRFPGVLGSGDGTLFFGTTGAVYVRIGNQVSIATCTRIQPVDGLAVWVGYANEEKTLYQILSTRTADANNKVVGGGYAPANRYRFMGAGGGQDVLWIEKRAWLPLRVGMTTPASMSVQIHEGDVWTGADFLFVPGQTVSLSAHIPSTADKAALVMISVNTSGAIVQTKGAEVDTVDLIPAGDEYSSAPAVPALTAEVIALVRVYNGQTQIREGRSAMDGTSAGFTDFIDARGLYSVGGGGIPDAPSDSVYYGRRNGIWTNLKTYFDGLYQAVGTYLTSANIEDSIVDGHTTIAPSGNAVFDALANKQPALATTAANDFQVGDGSGSWIKKTLAEVKTILGLGDAAYKNTGTTTGTVAAGDDARFLLAYKYPFEARLTLETGVPLSTTAQTAKTTLYLTKYDGDRIATFDAGGIATALPLTADVSLDISSLGRSQAYTNDPAAGSNITLNMTNTSGFLVGRVVRVSSSAGSEFAVITTVTTNTSIVVNALTLNHTTTSPLVTARLPYDIYVYNNAGALAMEALAWTNEINRATAITTQNGIDVKTGDITRRLAGTILMTNTIGQCEMSDKFMGISNHYNEMPWGLYRCPGYTPDGFTTQYAMNSATWIEATGVSAASLISFVLCKPAAASFNAVVGCIPAASQNVMLGLGIDTITNPGAQAITPNGAFFSTIPTSNNNKGLPLAAGSHYASLLLAYLTTAGNATIYADYGGADAGATDDPPATFITGSVPC